MLPKDFIRGSWQNKLFSKRIKKRLKKKRKGVFRSSRTKGQGRIEYQREEKRQQASVDLVNLEEEGRKKE